MRSLRIPPYDSAPPVTITDIWTRFRLAIIVAGLAGLAIIALLTRLAADSRKLARARLEAEHYAGDLERGQAVSHTGSWTLDIAANKLTWSVETYRIFGVPAGTPLTFERFVAVIHPEDREAVLAAWGAALNGTPYDIEHRVVAGGKVRWVRERAEVECGPGGQPLTAVGTVQDITDRRLKAQRQELERDIIVQLADRKSVV